MQIWKFPLKPGETVVFEVPEFAMLGPHFQPLTVQMQGDTPTLWALVNEDGPIRRNISVTLYATGQEVPSYRRGEYAGTVQDQNGLVWHAFVLSVDR